MQVLSGRRSAIPRSTVLAAGLFLSATLGCADGAVDALTSPVTAKPVAISPAALLVGTTNEPTGMTPFVADNGSAQVPTLFRATDPWTGLNGWGTTRTALVSDTSNPTRSGKVIEKYWYTGMPTDAAAKPGLISVWHWSSLNSTFRPARTLYVRMRVWFSSNWPDPNGNLAGMKFFYLKTSKRNMNVLWSSKNSDGRLHWAAITRHGPVGNYYFDTWTSSAVLHPLGAWHTVEFVYTMNSGLGTTDGRVQMWADGASVGDRTGVTFVAASDTANYAPNFDGIEFYPLRGTINYTFDRNDRFRLGELYVSGK